MRRTTATAQRHGTRAIRHVALDTASDPAELLLRMAADLVTDDPAAALAAASTAVAHLEDRRRVSDHTELSPAERRVATFAASGATNREIADRLFLSVRTIECHLSHAYAKLGVRSKAELAACWTPDYAGTR
jgi:DNA-binding CsgD family transcriptional regulator